MTGWGDALARVPEVGFDDHLLKPFGLERLRALCGRFEARHALIAPPGS
jgi:DNA-binding response OmpR family regulator